MIEVKHLHHRIAELEVLSDITLSLPKGGVTALIGPNGAGKSTLLSLIARLMPVQTGQITVDTLALGQTRSDLLAQKLAVLPQSSDIAPRLSVAQLVRFGRYPHSKGRLTAHCRAKVAEAIDRFDLSALQDRMIDTLSGGQRQRALIAMAYAQDTDYLLLDEPLNNLDMTAARQLMGLLRDMVRNQGKTVLIVLHDINYAASYADRVIAMKQGRVRADGAPIDVITEESLAHIFGTNARVLVNEGVPVVLV